MKTTIDIADTLLTRAKRLAARRGTTLRALIEAGLRRELELERSRPATGGVETATFSGHGLQLDWRNYKLSVDAVIESAADVAQQSLEVQQVLDRFLAACEGVGSRAAAERLLGDGDVLVDGAKRPKKA